MFLFYENIDPDYIYWGNSHGIKESMDIPIFIVDAFARVPFEGNPAAICLIGPEQVLFLLIDCSKVFN